MFEKISQFFQRLFRIGKAAQDVGTAAGSVQDIAKQGSLKDKVQATVQAANDVSSAGGSVQDAMH